jgi:hypothetical protein
MRPNRKLVYGKELAELPNGGIRHSDCFDRIGRAAAHVLPTSDGLLFWPKELTRPQLLSGERIARTYMRTFYDARLKDLGPNDFVYAECRCGRNDLLTRGMLKTAGVKLDDKLMDLGWRMRCHRCNQRGRVTISIRWAQASA